MDLIRASTSSNACSQSRMQRMVGRDEHLLGLAGARLTTVEAVADQLGCRKRTAERFECEVRERSCQIM
jgi:hypothetical protein